MLKEKLVSFLLPALDEQEAIPAVIEEIKQAGEHLKNNQMNYEIVISAGKCTDNTINIARRHGARVVTSDSGYGTQHNRGINACKGSIIITGDADASYPFSMAPTLINTLIDNNLHFITTNRFHQLHKGSMGVFNFMGNKVLTATTNILFTMSIKDSQSGMWVFNKDFVTKLSLLEQHMSFSQDIKIEAYLTSPAHFMEIPVYYKPRIGKEKITYNDGFKNMMHLIKKKMEIRDRT